MSLERVLEHTDQELVSKFKQDGALNLQALISLPTLFMSESFDNGNQVARVGRITSARIAGRDISLEYYYDLSIPPLTNNRIKQFSAEINMDEFEFNRTHWAVKDVDLFRVLLKNMQPRRQLPKVFQLSDPENIEPSLVSVMMPFDQKFNAVHVTIKKAATDAGLRCRRADDIWENPSVIQDVVTLIDRSNIVVCDCSDRNPNVFYETGIAHTLGREVVLITQNENDVPFDLRHLRYLKYLNNSEGLTVLSEKLKLRLADLI
ncbi:MAG: hypothetical protein ABH826_01165 [Patescibacteria group bacterium]